MTKNQTEAIAELRCALERCDRERVLLLVDNENLHAVSYDEFEQLGGFESGKCPETGLEMDEASLLRCARVTFEYMAIQVLNKWIFGGLSE